jgi:hypothetical protein
VIHLETPGGSQGYDHSNALRIESAMEAKELDRRILEAWNSHPRRHIVSSSEDFLTKASEALHVVRIQLPACCHSHPLPPRPGRQ